jgi:hypothetical protein
MKTITKLGLVTFAFAVTLYSCKQAEATAEEAVSENVKLEKSADTIANLVQKKDLNRKFIRTADIKFKVKNVPQSTYAIENTTAKFGGFVTYTNLQSDISEKTKTKISQDSTLETTKYNVENNITIRVPNTQLDTILKTISKQIDFLDFRVIKADDVSLQILANQLAQNRSTSQEKRVQKAIDTKGKKLTTIIDAEENLNAKKEANDSKKLENLSLQDQVNFSTVTLQIYQRETIKQEIVANEKMYRQNIGSKIIDGLRTGWFMLEEIIAFLIQLWSLFLIGIICFLVYKKYLKK